jgi:hypothetical protein
MFRHSTRASQADIQRLEGLMLLIEPSIEDQQEINELKQLKQHRNEHSSVAFDDDPDPDARAARLQMMAIELYDEGKRRNELVCSRANHYYAQQSKKMNSVGLSR